MRAEQKPTPSRRRHKRVFLAGGVLVAVVLVCWPDLAERLVPSLFDGGSGNTFRFQDDWSIDIKLIGITRDNRYAAAQTLLAEFSKTDGAVDGARLEKNNLISVDVDSGDDHWRVDFALYEPSTYMEDPNRSFMRFICVSARDFGRHSANEETAEAARKEATACLLAAMARVINRQSWQHEAKFMRPVPTVVKRANQFPSNVAG